jgi:Bacterial archaeo-eukaryotic release factor family 2
MKSRNATPRNTGRTRGLHISQGDTNHAPPIVAQIPAKVLNEIAKARHTVDGGGYPVHKSSATENDHAHPQLRTEEAIRRNVRTVAEDLIELVQEADPEIVFVSVEVRARTDVVSALPERVAHRVQQVNAGVRHRDVDDAAIRTPSMPS